MIKTELELHGADQLWMSLCVDRGRNYEFAGMGDGCPLELSVFLSKRTAAPIMCMTYPKVRLFSPEDVKLGPALIIPP